MIEPSAPWTIERTYFDGYGRAHAISAEDYDAIAFRLAPKNRPIYAGVLGLRQSDTPIRVEQAGGVRWELTCATDSIASGQTSDGEIHLPSDLTPGSYCLSLDDASGSATSRFLVLIAPDTAYQPPLLRDGKHAWLLTAQLYSVRSGRNWGHGDFTDLSDLLRIAADVGAAGIGINPLHALADGQVSPYSPSSRIFLNPLYIDVEAVPEFPGLAACGLDGEVNHLRQSSMIDYAGVAAAKTKALKSAHEVFRERGRGARRAEFEAFRQEQGEMLGWFAAFEALSRRFDSPWWDWPPAWRHPSESGLAELRRSAPEEVEFQEFVQWLADTQLRQCRDQARQADLPIGLFLDLAVGVTSTGADAWAEQDTLAPGLSIGAPPDAWNMAGQNWGITAFHPEILTATDFSLFRRTLRSVMRYAGAIRLDHAPGLNRLFLIPTSRAPSRGTYVRFPFDGTLAAVAQESMEQECLVIGEDLGTVPPGVSETLRNWGVWSYRVALFERDPSGSFRPPDQYPQRALVTFGTHDLPTFAAWVTGHDLNVMASIGLSTGEDRRARDKARGYLRDALRREGLAPNHELSFPAVARFLARARGQLLAISIEDVLGVADQINIPGTVAEHPNWRRRLPIDLADLAQHEGLKMIASVMETEGLRLRGRKANPTPPHSPHQIGT